MRLVFAAMLASGCLLEVDYDGTAFTCAEMVCPGDLVCFDNRCIEPTAIPDAASVIDAPPPDAPPFVCSLDCTQVVGFELCVCDSPTNWWSARDACAADGLVIARVDNQATADAVRAAAAALGDASVAPWIGGHDLVVEGEWQWAQGGDLFWTGLADGSAPAGVFSDWNPGTEPNQANNEDCLQGRTTGWNDFACGRSRAFICGR